MWVVAVGALHKPLVHAMAERHVEHGLLRKMACVTKLRLGLDQHELLPFGMVRRVAGDATDAAPRVQRVDGIRVLGTGSVASEAAGIHLACGSLVE